MGNTIATNPQMKESIKEAYTSDKQLFDKIFEKSREIYSKNKLQIGDKELYERLVITYSNQLYKLPLEKIETIYSQVEGQSTVKNELKPFLELSLKYDALEEEKFIINQLSGKLVENFKNKKIPAEVERNGIQLKLPDLYYIHNRVLLLLDGVQQRENNKLEQHGGIYFNPLALSNNGVIAEEDQKYINASMSTILNKTNKNNKNTRGGYMNNNNNTNNDPYNGNGNYNSINKGNNGNNFNQNKGKKELIIKPKYPQYPQKNQKKSLESIEKELEFLEKENNTKTTNTTKKNIPNTNKINTPQISTPPPAQKSKQIIIPEEDNLCIDPTVPCKLTKMEMCVKIVMNLMIRNNIILAILSTIPIQNKNDDYEGGFTFERLISLKKGRFCAPSPLLHVKDEDDHVRIHKILKFLNMMDDDTCKKSGGDNI